MNPVASRNVTFVSHSDQAGRSDGVQIMVHRGYAYIGQTFSNGITILDVRDPKHPKFVDFIACPPNTRSIHLQAHEDLFAIMGTVYSSSTVANMELQRCDRKETEMGEILGIGATHYPPGLVPDEYKPWALVDWLETWIFNAPKCLAVFR